MAAHPILLEPFSSWKKRSIKEFTESSNLNSIPSIYNFSQHHSLLLPYPVATEEIPTIDFSLLVNGTPDQRSRIVRDLSHACSEWGFFMVVNHGVEESLRERMLEVCHGFFDLSEAEKGKYAGRHLSDPIRCGTSHNTSVDKVLYWRDFLRVVVHPAFHSFEKPADFRDVSNEYCTKVRALARELLRGVSESLGLEGCYLDKASELEHSLQILIANFYPRCPQPELAMGLPPHSDHGLLTIFMQNDVSGLQVKHNGRWVPVNPLPNSFLVNTGDQLEILSNGKYKSVLHQAVVNNQSARLSIAVTNGPSPDKAVTPAPQLVDGEQQAAYSEMTYREYMVFKQSNHLDGKSSLDLLRLHPIIL